MEDQVVDLATQGGDNGEGGAANDGSGNAGAGNNEPFLKVDDRTVYKSREDAVRAYSEAGRRIATLSPYEKALKEFYGDQHSPETLRAHLAELVEIRKEKAAQAAREAAAGASQADQARFEGKSAEEIKQIKAAEKWFKDEAERLGYVSKDALKKLEDKLAAIEAQPQQQQEAGQQEAASAGETELRRQLGESKVDLTEDEFGTLAARIKAYIDADDRLVSKWLGAVRRGDTATTNALILEAAKYSLPLVKAGAKFIDPKAAAQAGAQQKSRLMNLTPKKLPQQGVGTQQAAQKPKFTSLKDPALTKLAMARFDELTGTSD